MNARWMDTETGRFISPDPARQGVNWYVYAQNNPTSQIDPTGLSSFDINDYWNYDNGYFYANSGAMLWQLSNDIFGDKDWSKYFNFERDPSTLEIGEKISMKWGAYEQFYVQMFDKAGMKADIIDKAYLGMDKLVSSGIEAKEWTGEKLNVLSHIGEMFDKKFDIQKADDGKFYVNIDKQMIEIDSQDGYFKLPEQGKGYSTYFTEDNALWGKEQVIEALLSTTYNFSNKNKDKTVQIGHISKEDGESAHTANVNGVETPVHTGGKEVDFELLTKKKNTDIGNFYTGTNQDGSYIYNTNYDQRRNKQLINMLANYNSNTWFEQLKGNTRSNAGIDYILFNDPKIYNNIQNVKPYSGHSNHWHARFRLP